MNKATDNGEHAVRANHLSAPLHFCVPVGPEPRSSLPVMRIVDTPQHLTVAQVVCPLWFLYGCLSLPVVGFGWVFVRDALIGHWEAMETLGLVIALLAIPTMFGVITYVHRHLKAQADIPPFSLEKAQWRLRLPESGTELRKEEILALVEVHVYRMNGDSWEWTGELSVLKKMQEGNAERHVLLIAHSKVVSRIAKQTAEFLNVPCRTTRIEKKGGRFRGIV